MVPAAESRCPLSSEALTAHRRKRTRPLRRYQQRQISQCLWCMWYKISWYTYHEKRTSYWQLR
jgi:hypothetical protein